MFTQIPSFSIYATSSQSESEVGSLLSHGSLLVAFPLRRHGPAESSVCPQGVEHSHRRPRIWDEEMSSVYQGDAIRCNVFLHVFSTCRTSCGSWDLPVSWCGAPLTSAPRSEGLANRLTGPGALLERKHMEKLIKIMMPYPRSILLGFEATDICWTDQTGWRLVKAMSRDRAEVRQTLLQSKPLVGGQRLVTDRSGFTDRIRCHEKEMTRPAQGTGGMVVNIVYHRPTNHATEIYRIDFAKVTLISSHFLTFHPFYNPICHTFDRGMFGRPASSSAQGTADVWRKRGQKKLRGNAEIPKFPFHLTSVGSKKNSRPKRRPPVTTPLILRRRQTPLNFAVFCLAAVIEPCNVRQGEALWNRSMHKLYKQVVACDSSVRWWFECLYNSKWVAETMKWQCYCSCCLLIFWTFALTSHVAPSC